MATRSSILAWEIPWTEGPGGPQSGGSQRVRLSAHTHTHTHRLISTVLYIRQYYYPSFAGKENKVKFAKH